MKNKRKILQQNMNNNLDELKKETMNTINKIKK